MFVFIYIWFARENIRIFRFNLIWGKMRKLCAKIMQKFCEKIMQNFTKIRSKIPRKNTEIQNFSEYKMNILQKKVFEGFIGIYKDFRTTRRQFIDLLVSY